MQTVNRRVRPSITCRGGQAVRKNGKSGRAPDTGKDVMRTAPAQMVNASDVWEDAGASSGMPLRRNSQSRGFRPEQQRAHLSGYFLSDSVSLHVAVRLQAVTRLQFP